jgi:hypothetical protein
MARSSYMPDREAGQVAWFARFVATLTPSAPLYGVSGSTLTSLTSLNDTVQSAWAAAADPTTRTRATVADKTAALAQMRAAVRPVVSVIQGTATVTDGMLVAAGLTVRKTKPTPRPAPSERPTLTVLGVDGRTVTVRLVGGTKRSRPDNAVSATVLTSAGPTRPLTADGYQFALNTTQTTVSVPFGPSETGDTVWITAFWNGSRGEISPAATAVSVDLPAGGALEVKTVRPTHLRIADAA